MYIIYGDTVAMQNKINVNMKEGKLLTELQNWMQAQINLILINKLK